MNQIVKELLSTYLAVLALLQTVAPEQLGGLGGLTEMITVETTLRLTKHDAGKVNFRSQFAAVTETDALDICVLGRDILGLFAAISDTVTPSSRPKRLPLTFGGATFTLVPTSRALSITNSSSLVLLPRR